MSRLAPAAAVVALALALPATAAATPGSGDSDAPPGAPPHWLPNEEWVYQHWLPYDERELERALGMSRGVLWRILRDDVDGTIADAAREHGLDPAAVARSVVRRSWRGVRLAPERRALLQARALRTLTQGHLAQHIFFHSLHQNAIPDNAAAVFGTASRAEFQRLRRSELSPVQICRLYGGTRAQAVQRAQATLRRYAHRAVDGQAMPPVQARRLLARQLAQLPRWLGQTRYNGPPPVKTPRSSLATASNYSNNAAIAAGARRLAWEGYEASLPALKQKGEINVFAAAAGAEPVLASPRDETPIVRTAPRSAYNPTISADGRFVAYEASEGNLNFAKRYGRMQILVRDLEAGTTSGISHGLRASSHDPAISGDGRLVAFVSGDAVVIRGRDGRHERTVRVAGAALSEPALSADGGVLAFSATRGGDSSVLVRDLRDAETTTLARGDAYEPALSADGRRVALIDRGALRVIDRAGGTARTLAREGAGSPSISADGSRVAFTLRDAARRTRVVVTDVDSGTQQLASRRVAPAIGSSGAPALSPDGRFVAFTSDAYNLDPRKCNSARGVFVRDLERGTTTLASRSDGTNRWKGPTSWSSTGSDGFVTLLCR